MGLTFRLLFFKNKPELLNTHEPCCGSAPGKILVFFGDVSLQILQISELLKQTGQGQPVGGGGRKHVQLHVFQGDLVAAQDHEALHHVAQFADIAGPVELLQGGYGGFFDLFGGAPFRRILFR
jgi:hypothetical protein